MVKAKHQRGQQNNKSKPPPKCKKQRGGAKTHTDFAGLAAHVDALGLKIIPVTADGNCFYRALADQLEGNEDEYKKYRRRVVEFIKNNRELFEPFIEDERPFDEYVQSMEEDGTWAGNIEMSAASHLTHTNIYVHMLKPPHYINIETHKHGTPYIHFSYHDEEHYNSVRTKEDTCLGPARPIFVNSANKIVKQNPAKGTDVKSEHNIGGSVRKVMAISGCEDALKIEEVLQLLDVDVDAAVEVLKAGSVDQIVFDDEFSHSKKSSSGGPGNDADGETSNEIEKNNGKKNSWNDDKKINRNKHCPCGSRKKYKSCCGTVAGTRASARLLLNQTVQYGKNRKDRKQGSKNMNSIQSDRAQVDIGALCI